MEIRKITIIPVYLFSAALIALLTPACNLTKKVPAGDALYMGATLKLTDSSAKKGQNKILKSDLLSLIRPKPNSSILGIRFKLGLYNLAGTKNNFINKFLRKNGEPPVLLSAVKLDRNELVLVNTLENKGFFKAKVAGDTVVKAKKATANYVANGGYQYKINEVHFPEDSSAASKAIRDISAKTILKKGDPFILDVIKGERIRIDLALKEKGFYYFSPDDLIIQYDSTIGNHENNLYVRFKPETPDQAKHAFIINKAFIYSNYNLNTAARDTLKSDTVLYDNYYVIDRKKTFKPSLFDQMIVFEPGDLYNRTDHNLTLNRLINLGAFKFVKNRFEEVRDSLKLNTYYYLTPLPKKSLSAEIGGLSKSNNVTGGDVTVRWRNRNAFRGAELLTINAYFGTEVQFSGQYSGYNTLRYGTEANLTFPRILVPFFDLGTSSAYVPRTNIQFGYDILQRQKLYSLNSFRGQFGYIWKPNARRENTLNLISVSYVQPLNVTQTYTDSIKDNPILRRAIEKQFIIGSNFNYNYNQLANAAKNAAGLYFNGLLDLSGNIAGLLSGSAADAKNGKTVSIFGTPFSQYIKTEFDTRYYLKVAEKHQWANRLIIGVGLPYGNSTILPYVKQFFVGGSNSLRGFRSRSVGPGTYGGGQIANSKGFLPDITGDIKLEFNTEFRANLGSILQLATFIDVGNVWLYNDNTSYGTGSKFTKDFIKEFAADAGVGLRLDLSILLLRLDLGIPIRKPYLPDGQRNVINQIDFGSKDWRSQNMIYNLAIGLPF